VISALITAPGVGEGYSPSSGSGWSPAAKRIIAQLIAEKKSANPLKVSHTCRCPNFHCNGKIILIFLSGTRGRAPALGARVDVAGHPAHPIAAPLCVTSGRGLPTPLLRVTSGRGPMILAVHLL